MVKSVRWYEFMASAKNISEFERIFETWDEKTFHPGKNTSVIFFDESEFRKILDRLLKSTDCKNLEHMCGLFFSISSSGNTKTVLHNLEFEWKNLGDDKCVLQHIYTRDGHTVYKAPTSWREAKTIYWICDRISVF